MRPGLSLPSIPGKLLPHRNPPLELKFDQTPVLAGSDGLRQTGRGGPEMLLLLTFLYRADIESSASEKLWADPGGSRNSFWKRGQEQEVLEVIAGRPSLPDGSSPKVTGVGSRCPAADLPAKPACYSGTALHAAAASLFKPDEHEKKLQESVITALQPFRQRNYTVTVLTVPSPSLPPAASGRKPRGTGRWQH